jgi:hypothetical protein
VVAIRETISTIGTEFTDPGSAALFQYLPTKHYTSPISFHCCNMRIEKEEVNIAVKQSGFGDRVLGYEDPIIFSYRPWHNKFPLKTQELFLNSSLGSGFHICSVSIGMLMCICILRRQDHRKF